MARSPLFRRLLPLLALLTLLGATAAAYSPGLSGPFLLDDWGTLPKLGAYGPVDNPATFVSYVTDGIAGPTGRPIALASFLIDAHNWPANPWPFKLTNVLLHLLNGVVLALLLRLLTRSRGVPEREAAWIGVLGAGLWLLHPLFVSTTLYVVQRMTELAALFVFGGLALYTLGRERLVAGRRGAYVLMTAGIVGGTLLGTFAKENAALLPLLALVLEGTVFAAAGRPRAGPRSDPGSGAAGKWRERLLPARWPRADGWSAFRATFLWLPAAAIAGFLLWQLRHVATPLPYRNFSIGTRLLTEGRVVARYLYLLVIPHGGTGGLYTTVTVSHSPLHPWTTLPALLLILALIGGAVAVRRRWPVLAAAVLFYFVGQLLESTTVPLELYYEHRNYLPAALLFWPVALWAIRGAGSRRWRAGVAVAILAVFGLLTAYRAALWGNGVRLALTWMQLDPASPRAVVWGSTALTVAGRPALALAELRRASTALPDDVSVALSRLNTACETGAATPADLQAAAFAAGHGRVGSKLIYDSLLRLERYMRSRPCPPLTVAELLRIPAAALANPHFRRYPAIRQQFLILRAKLLLALGHTDAAYATFSRALPLNPTPDVALTAAAALYGAKAPRLGIALLDQYERFPKRPRGGWSMARIHYWWLNRIGWYRESFRLTRKALRQQLRDETQKAGAPQHA